MIISPYQKPFRGLQLNKVHPLSRGLVSAWVMNEGVGATLFDTSGNGNNLTWYLDNAGAYSWGGGWLTNDGGKFKKSRFRTITPNFPHIDTGPYTIVSSLKPRAASLGVDDTVLLEFDNVDPEWGFDNGYLKIYDSTRIQMSSSIFSADTWYNIAVGRAGTGVNEGFCYVDGEFNNNFTHDSSIDKPVEIGLFHGQYSNFYGFTGSMKFLYFYDRILTASEVAWIHREPYTMFENYSNPAMLYMAGGVVENNPWYYYAQQ